MGLANLYLITCILISSPGIHMWAGLLQRSLYCIPTLRCFLLIHGVIDCGFVNKLTSIDLLDVSLLLWAILEQ